MHDDSALRRLVRRAKSGDDQALGQLLETYRSYIRLLASLQIHRRLQGKLSASDLVQETFLHAKRGFGQFRGETEAEIVAWLRRILATQLATLMRRFYAQRRDVNLEQHLAAELDQSSQAIGNELLAHEDTPSQDVERRERVVLLAQALDRLKPDYRDVIVLRHLEGHSFPEVAQRMGRTLNSVKNMWARAIAQLRDELQGL